MSGGFYFVEDVLDLAVGADHERHAGNAFEHSAVESLVLDDAEGMANLLVGVGEQGVGEVVLLLELLLFGGGIGGNAEDDRSRLFDVAVCVAEPARFFGSAGSVRFGIEKQDHRLAPKIF